MAIGTVQTTTGTTGSSYLSSFTSSLSSPTTTGNLLLAVIGTTVDTGVSSPGGNIVSSITDTSSNTWTLARKIMGNNNCGQEIWYAKNITGGSSVTVTVNMSQAIWGSMVVKEYSGLNTTAPLDVYSESASGSAGTTFLTGDTIPTSNVYELVVAACSVEEVATITEQSSTGYGATTVISASPKLITLAVCDKVVSATGVQDASFLSSQSAYGVSQVATFKDDGSGPPTWTPGGAIELLF